jgi:HAD superfamily hydrolase (TIGR01509 family)
VALRALLWDVDGTLAETERDGHRRSFNRAFADAGLPIRWDRDSYARWLRISGGHERIRAQLEVLEGMSPDPQRVAALQAAKQRHYQQLLAEGALQLRPGVADLLQEAQRANLVQVIVTTSGRRAVQALMDHLLGPLEQVFLFWVCGEDVRHKKPHPEAYRLAYDRLCDGGHVRAPDQLLVLEDSAHGLTAAGAAGLPCVLTLSEYGARDQQTDWGAASAVVSELGPAAQVLQGPPCHQGQITLSYLQLLQRCSRS